jgi:hypothetical protein
MISITVIAINLDNVPSNQLNCVEELDIFFMRITSKEIPQYESKILTSINTYFEKGQFTAFNNTFNRFIKTMKNLSEQEIHNFIIRYTISSIIKKNWDNFSTDIFHIRQYYTQYDMNIYL